MSYLSNISDLLRKKPKPNPIVKPTDFFKEHLLRLEAKLDNLTKFVIGTDYDYNELEDMISKLELKINEAIEEAHLSDLYWKVEELIERLTAFKKETDFFDKEDRLDLAFSDEVDADFDEESMSHTNEFGADQY